MSNTLLPCPFCGGEAAECDIKQSFANGWVGCQRCRCFMDFVKNGKPFAIAAWNRRADAVPAVRGEWDYTIKKGSCMDYSVTAKCSKCGWDWFSKDGVGNYSAVFGAFITNGDSRPEEAKRFLLENARANNKLNYCPNCGSYNGGDKA